MPVQAARRERNSCLATSKSKKFPDAFKPEFEHVFMFLKFCL